MAHIASGVGLQDALRDSSDTKVAEELVVANYNLWLEGVRTTQAVLQLAVKPSLKSHTSMQSAQGTRSSVEQMEDSLEFFQKYIF